MKLRTTVNVTHIDVEDILSASTKSGKVTLELGDNFQFVCAGGQYVFNIPFKWTDEDGNELPNKKNNIVTIPPYGDDSPDAVKNVSMSINALIPATNNIVDRIMAEIEVLARQEIMATWSITNSQIELIP